MSTVTTVTGDVDSHRLGRTLIHEHVICALPGYELDYTDEFDDREAVAVAAGRLRAARAHGVTAVVDATPMNWYRRPDLLIEVSELSDVYVIASTGLYTDRMGYPFHLKLKSASELASVFRHELEVGIGGTSIRAGVVKVATGADSATRYERRTLEAAAIASRASHVAVITHSESLIAAHEQATILLAAGADPSKVLIGHCDRPTFEDGHRGLLGTGVRIGFDRVGFEFDWEPGSADRAALVHAAIRAGAADQVLLSHDFVAYSRGPWFRTADMPLREAHGFAYISRELIPRLQARGVAQDLIDRITIDNPRLLLASS